MSDLQLAPAPATIGARSRRLAPSVALYLQASIILLFLAASSAPTPLYAVYQARWGFSPITATIVFGVYAVAVLVALLTVGALSDHIGRRPVLLAALALQAVAMIVFVTADGVPMLMLARVAQGLATGAAAGAVGAGMLDLDRARGTLANSVAPMLGTATGGLLSGLLVQYLPAPLHLVYLVLLAAFGAQALGVLFMAESVTPKAGAWRSLRPHISVPAIARRPFLVAVPVLVAVWALGGFYASIGPGVVREVTGSSSLVLGGLALFTLAGTGALSVFVLRDMAARAVMQLGIVALVVGVALTLVAIGAGSSALLFTGCAVAGVGFGSGFQGSVRMVVPLAAAHERSGLLSAVYVVSYLALGLPAVIGGYLEVYSGGLLTTAREYGLAVIALALLALVGLVRGPVVGPAAAPAVASAVPPACRQLAPQ